MQRPHSQMYLLTTEEVCLPNNHTWNVHSSQGLNVTLPIQVIFLSYLTSGPTLWWYQPLSWHCWTEPASVTPEGNFLLLDVYGKPTMSPVPPLFRIYLPSRTVWYLSWAPFNLIGRRTFLTPVLGHNTREILPLVNRHMRGGGGPDRPMLKGYCVSTAWTYCTTSNKG